MSDHVVLENIPNTAEGRAFLKQLRKYLRPQYKMRSRGRNRDRKGLAERLVREGIVTNTRPREVTLTAADLVSITHLSLRTGMSCKYADRITTVIEARNEQGIRWRSSGGARKRGFYLYAGMDNQQGPFTTWDAAMTAKRITEGITQERNQS